MTRTILITGATAGIGRETATALAARGHHLLVHGRSAGKVEALVTALADGAGPIEGYVADLSHLTEVEALARAVAEKHDAIDVLINNAGVLKTREPITPDGQDVRFVVNTLAPVLLTRRLLPLMGPSGRVINLSSAAQSPVNLAALAGSARITTDFEAYAQSKLAMTMWSCALGETLGARGPTVIAVNPGSMLGTNMVRDGFGVAGKDVRIGSSILVRLALDDLADAQGAYFDNDAGRFASPHPDALDPAKCRAVVEVIDGLIGSGQGVAA